MRKKGILLILALAGLFTSCNDAIDITQPGEISNPIKTKYAYHIIQKLELDDMKYEEYLNDLRTNKCIEDLKEYFDELKVIYHEGYEKIKIK